MANFDAAHRQELWDALVYEFYAIAEYRARLYHQHDDVHSVIKHVLGAMSADGSAAAVTIEGVGSARTSDRRVREALGIMRPHAFATAFKVHDMILEWILGPKPAKAGKKPPRWTLEEKGDAVRSLSASDLPPELQDAARLKTVLDLFDVLIEPRNVATHRKGIDLRADGAVAFGLSPPKVSEISDELQGSYLRSMAILGEALASVRALDRFRALRLDASLSKLSVLPGLTPIQAVEPEWIELDVEVPAGGIVGVAPLTCRVDFDLIGRVWREHEGRSPNKVILGMVRVRAAGASFSWHFAPDALLAGVVDLAKGVPQHDVHIVLD